MTSISLLVTLAMLCLLGCGREAARDGQRAAAGVDTSATAAGRSAAVDTAVAAPELPEPYATESAVKFARVLGWPEGRKPAAPEGFEVTLYADGLDHPRWLYVLPNGDVLVAESNTEPEAIGGGQLPEALVRGLKRRRRSSARRPTASRCCGTPTATGRPRRARRFWRG